MYILDTDTCIFCLSGVGLRSGVPNASLTR